MKHLFLDLEDTVILPVVNGWQNTELINIDLVREVIRAFKPDSVSLFSFAIHNKQELEGFEKFIRKPLQDAIGRSIARTPTMDDDIIPLCAKAMRLHPSKVAFMDAVDFWSKHQAFRLYISQIFGLHWKEWQRKTEVLLLDDAAFENESWEWPDLAIKGGILRV